MRNLILLLAATMLPLSANASESQSIQTANLTATPDVVTAPYWVPAETRNTPVEGKIVEWAANEQPSKNLAFGLRKFLALKAFR